MRKTIPEQGVAKAVERYDAGAIAFHWTVAALIVFLGALGLLFDEIPRASAPFWISVHADVGLIYFALVIARLVWRASHRPPDLPTDIGEFSRRASITVHHLLYALMALIPIFGFVAYVWHGRAFDYGLFQVNFGVASNRNIFHAGEKVHQWLAYALFGVAALHVAGALWHHYVRRDRVILRILPGGAA
jgi:cytochrome b561